MKLKVILIQQTKRFGALLRLAQLKTHKMDSLTKAFCRQPVQKDFFPAYCLMHVLFQAPVNPTAVIKAPEPETLSLINPEPLKPQSPEPRSPQTLKP